MEKILVNILREQVVPAFGCTEPIAVAFAVAKAKEMLKSPLQKLDILVDKNVYKNAIAVFIPGTGQRGIKVAAALALVCGKSQYKLQVLKDLKPGDLDEALKILERDFIDVGIKYDAQNLFIEVLAEAEDSAVKVVIEGKHDHIVLVEKDGEVLFSEELHFGEEEEFKAIQNYDIWDLVTFCNKVSLEELGFIDEGITMNLNMAKAWFDDNGNLALGCLRNDPSDLNQFVKANTAAACAARMTGYPLPVMSCAGSGNHGITVFIPVAAVGIAKDIDREKIMRCVTLSALITLYIKSYTKTLSPVCGCAVAAGIGASAGITYMLGGDRTQIEGAINNMIGGVSGMLCDGGKPGCAFKLSIAAGAALEAATMALQGIFISPLDGIVDDTVEKSIQNMGVVSTLGMENTDEVILELILKKAACQ